MGKVPDNDANGSRCICAECPSYPKKGGVFCAKGKSENPVRERGCVCGDCAVYKEYKLSDAYYCIHGQAE